jgi:hypothetical protein
MDNNPFFQGGKTLLHPAVAAFTLSLGLALITVSRRWVLLPLCLTLCFVPMQQRLMIGGLNFDMGRIMILFGWARLLTRRELNRLRLTALDQSLVLWVAVGTLFYFLGDPGMRSLTYRAGIMFDALGMFFLCRALVRNSSDVSNAVEILCWISLAIVPFMAFESITRFNPFSIFGGLDAYDVVRDGRVRAQAAFPHPIMAGTFGATLFPLAITLWRARPRRRLAAGAGMIGSVALTLLVASSGPLMALVAGVVGWGLWSVRRYMRLILWGFVILLVVLHLVRAEPVWHLIGRVSDFTGGTGWHRYALIDAFIGNWRDWIMVGMGTRSTRQWGWGLEDVTNQFVAEGVQGGIATMAAFIALLSVSFASISRILVRADRVPGLSADRRHGFLTFGWGLGVALFAHCMSWISVSYFGQMWDVFYIELALIAALRTDPSLWSTGSHTPRAVRLASSRRRAVAGSEEPPGGAGGLAPGPPPLRARSPKPKARRVIQDSPTDSG